MSFRLDPRFFSNPSGPHNAEVRVVYLDKGRGAWALKYAGADTGEPAELKMQCEDSGEWKEAIFQIDAARFDSSLPGGADMQLALLEGDDVIFHLLELNRR
ncbi:MAG: hypothetical protein BWZ10_02936 [candidate division BRC1 bacterium ADurb.BinA364]|nr:MAG: hypothetical protein BWZ10_02936 [candidate division BRC1 bacterium ADurb.BinA364]